MKMFKNLRGLRFRATTTAFVLMKRSEDGVPSVTSSTNGQVSGLCAWSRPCSLDASTASVAAGCGCAPRTLSGSKSAVHHLNDELRLRAPLSIVALAPSSLTATRCPQLKQVVRRCPQLLLRLGVKTCCHYVNVLERVTSKTVVQHVPVSDKLQWQRPFHFISSSSPSSSTTLKYIILLLPPTLFGVSCRNIFFTYPIHIPLIIHYCMKFHQCIPISQVAHWILEQPGRYREAQLRQRRSHGAHGAPARGRGVRRRRPAEATSEVGILKFEEILVFFLGVPLNPHEIAIKSPMYSPHLSVPANLPGMPLRGVEEGVVARCRQLFLGTLHGVAQDGLKGGTKDSQQ